MPHRPVSSLAPVSSRGRTLVVIGGAEDRTGDCEVLRQVVDRAGGDAPRPGGPRIAVVATASSLGAEIFDAYDDAFGGLGAAPVLRLRPQTRDEADDPELVAVLDEADAVFLSGGNQLKLAAVLRGSA